MTLLSAVLSLDPLATSAGSRPRITHAHGRYSIELTVSMTDAIRRFDPSFAPWSDGDYLPEIREFYRYTERQTPFAVLGDINGDGRIDAVLDGRTRSRSVLLAVLSRRNGYTARVVQQADLIDPKTNWYGSGIRRQYGKDSFLTHVGPQRIKSTYETMPLVLRHDAFEINFWERAASIYFYRKGRFQSYTSSD